jgi:cold shock CspA family protein
MITKTCRLCLLEHSDGGACARPIEPHQDRRGLAHYHGYVSIPASAVAKRPKVEPIPEPEPTEPEPEPTEPEPTLEFVSEPEPMPEPAAEPEITLIWDENELPEGFEAGVVKMVNRVKGYFFISTNDGDIFSFFGDSEFPSGHTCGLQPGTPCIFIRQFHPQKGNDQAVAVNINVSPSVQFPEVEVSQIVQVVHRSLCIANRLCGCPIMVDQLFEVGTKIKHRHLHINGRARATAVEVA